MDIQWLDRLPGRATRQLLVVPAVLIVAITVAGLVSPDNVHLSPLLVIAPALTASIAGPWSTAIVGAVAVGAEVLVMGLNGGVGTANHIWQFTASLVLTVLVVFFCYVRQSRSRQLTRVQVVAETAQRVLLRPPPARVGPLRVAWRYLTADAEAQIGGDLFAVARTGRGGSRVIIGDVRGKGLAAIGEASVVLGGFRAGARSSHTLPALIETLEDCVSTDLEEVADIEHDLGEHFVTALVLDLPDSIPEGTMISCGHPPPLLMRDGRATFLHTSRPAPPLGLSALHSPSFQGDTFAFTIGDTLLLYTDGVTEARSPQGVFYPLAERAATFPAAGPEELLRHLLQDVAAHTGGRLSDDVAVLAIERVSVPGGGAAAGSLGT